MMIGPGQLYSFGFVFRFKVWRIKIIFPSYADKREQRIAPGVGERCPIRCAETISAIGHTGHSEEIHSPDE
jgi:hypothetical protein